MARAEPTPEVTDLLDMASKRHVELADLEDQVRIIRRCRNLDVIRASEAGASLRTIAAHLGVTHAAVKKMIDAPRDTDD